LLPPPATVEPLPAAVPLAGPLPLVALPLVALPLVDPLAAEPLVAEPLLDPLPAFGFVNEQ
jgi:hypothetical protein